MAREISEVLSHWHKLFEGIEHSSQEVYKRIEIAVNSRNMPKVKISRVNHKEGGLASARREYLRVRRKEFIFDVCAAPFGKGFFVSWWLGEKPGLIASLFLLIPGIGPFLVLFFRPITYYRYDTALMFQDSLQAAVLEAIDEVTDGKGLKLLTESEKKPIMRDLFKR